MGRGSGSHRSRGGKKKKEAADKSSLGAAAAMPDDSVKLLRDRIHDFLQSISADRAEEIDEDLAHHLLDASSGDVNLAAEIFVDNILTGPSPKKHQKSGDKRKRREKKSAHNGDDDDDGNDRKRPARRPGDDPEEEEDEEIQEEELEQEQPEDDDDQADEDDEDESEDQSPVRRRLLDNFDRAAEDEVAPRLAAAARRRRDEDEDEDDDDEDEAIEVDGNNNINGQDQVDEIPGDGDDVVQEPNPVAGSVSVSDDEGGGGIFRMERRRRAAVEDDPVQANIAQNNVLSRRISDQPDQERGTGGDRNEDDDELVMSDDDLLGGGRVNVGPSQPTRGLWGRPSSSGGNEAGPHNVLDDEDGPKSTKIAQVWLKSGFNMAPDGSGLIVKTPSDEDVALERWRQHQNGRGNENRSIVLPPQHCKSLTALLAIVNATMLTGASIQGNVVDSSSARKLIWELTEKERIQESESRLANALSALLFVALGASNERRQRAMDSRKQNNARASTDPAEIQQRQAFARKSNLCPTCRWEEEPTAGQERPPLIVTSGTNKNDIVSYVKSNMNAFTSLGGCALFLETILHIHGKNAVASMVRKARRKCGLTTEKGYSMICCTCEERQTKTNRSQQNQSSSSATNKPVLDTTPPGHTCMSVELVSLLVCGEVHASFKGWSSGSLGFGILSNTIGEMGGALTKPEKPVWILRGETCHTVAWFDPTKDTAVDVSQLDQPGTAFHLAHWNFWYGQRNKSSLRVISARGKWAPPVSRKQSASFERTKKTIVDSIKDKKRKQLAAAIIVSADEQDDMLTNAISDEELEHVCAHPDDEHFYPNKYRRWRYKFSGDTNPASGGWLAYHGLSERQRLLVEMKHAPKICRLIWSRWPSAIVDKFEPVDEELPVV